MKVDHVSWSRENTFARCGQQYVYIYEEGLKRPPGVAQIRGQAPHRSAEADLSAKLKGGALLEREAVGQVAIDHVDRAFKGEVTIDGEFEGLSLKEAKRICREDARKMAWWHHDELAPNIQPTALEVYVRGVFPDLPVPYDGVIDVVDADRRLRDLKTKTRAPEKQFAHTSEQLTVYWALFSLWKSGRPPADLAFDVLWVTPKGKQDGTTLMTTRSASDWAVKVRRTLLFLRAVEREVYLPAPVDHWVCSPRWCGYTDVCPYYRGRPRPTS